MRTQLLILVLSLTFLSSCSTIGGAILDTLTDGGGPQVNAQIGKENTQQIVGNQTDVKGDLNRETVKADRVETVVINEVPVWVILLLVVGWLLPTPTQIGSYIGGLLWPRNQR